MNDNNSAPKLTMAEIAPYLPHQVKMIFKKSGDVQTLTGLSLQNDNKTVNFIFGAMTRMGDIWFYVPILHRMPKDVSKVIDPFKMHYDVFGLIDKGLAMDANDIE
jgi:hypothetical protein